MMFKKYIYKFVYKIDNVSVWKCPDQNWDNIVIRIQIQFSSKEFYVIDFYSFGQVRPVF